MIVFANANQLIDLKLEGLKLNDQECLKKLYLSLINIPKLKSLIFWKVYITIDLLDTIIRNILGKVRLEEFIYEESRDYRSGDYFYNAFRAQDLLQNNPFLKICSVNIDGLPDFKNIAGFKNAKWV